jgi:hypothetical protein
MGIPLRAGFNAQLQTEIPSSQEMIAAARLELLDTDAQLTSPSEDALNKLAMHGFNDYWAKVLYSSSFEPPNLTDFLNTYARSGTGPPNEAEIQSLITSVQAIVNIDATRFGSTFMSRALSAPGLIQLRTGYESGAYTGQDVERWMRWNLIHPHWWDATKNSITRFAGRKWNEKYVRILGKMYLADQISRDDFDAKISEVYADPIAREWLIRSFDVEREYASKVPTKAAIAKTYALPMTWYIRLYLAKKITTDGLIEALKATGLRDFEAIIVQKTMEPSRPTDLQAGDRDWET